MRGCNWGDERLPERFWKMVSPEPNGGCWFWTGAVNHSEYGKAYSNGKHVRSHRWAYEALVGSIPEGLHIDHLCKNTRCCNPCHLEAVTPRENTMRGDGPTALRARATHCKHGHELSGDNLMVSTRGERGCRDCHNRRRREYFHRHFESKRDEWNQRKRGGAGRQK